MNLDLIKNIISKIPIIDLIPIFLKAWDSLPEETKEEYAKILLAAAMKAAASYAESK